MGCASVVHRFEGRCQIDIGALELMRSLGFKITCRAITPSTSTAHTRYCLKESLHPDMSNVYGMAQLNQSNASAQPLPHSPAP